VTEGFTPDQEKVLEQIQKLLNLAAKNPNEHEAALAASKAQELLTKHNLDTAALERSQGAVSGKRQQEEVEGGFYRYHREVWSNVARLNFCLHWVQRKHVPREERVRNVRVKRIHRLVGRTVNVRTTINLARYLLAAIERVTRETCEQKKIGHLSGWAMSFREGCAYRLINALRDRRTEMLDEEDRKRREAEDRAARAGISLETSLTITSFSRSEEEANLDERFGEGYSARQREREAAYAKKQAENEAAYTRWAAANPEKARKKEAEAKAKEERQMERWRRSASDQRYGHVNNQAFWAGHEAAKDISLDPQMGGAKQAKRIGGKS
jgi:hypothetical protein